MGGNLPSSSYSWLETWSILLRYDTDFGGSTRFGHGTKIHKSVIWLNWVMFDSKIIIYVKFWVWQRRSKFLGGKMLPLNFQICPLKCEPLFLILARKARINVPISQPVGGIFKNPYILIEFCVWAGRSWSEITPPPNNRGARCKKTKKWPYSAFSGWFLSLSGGASRFLGWGVISLQDPPSHTQNSISM